MRDREREKEMGRVARKYRTTSRAFFNESKAFDKSVKSKFNFEISNIYNLQESGNIEK